MPMRGTTQQLQKTMTRASSLIGSQPGEPFISSPLFALTGPPVHWAFYLFALVLSFSLLTARERMREGGDGEVGTSSSRRFPPAAQPEIMRAAEKDDHYAAYLHDACRDAFRHLFGELTAALFRSKSPSLNIVFRRFFRVILELKCFWLFFFFF